MTNEQLYSISELSAMFDISSRTIRYYEEVGLLVSKSRTSNSQQRYYTNEERRRLKLILRGKRLGFSLQEVKEMIELYEANPQGEAEKQQIIDYGEQKLQEIEEKINELLMLKGELLTYRERLFDRQS